MQHPFRIRATVRERLLRFPPGEKRKQTIPVPGKTVEIVRKKGD